MLPLQGAEGDEGGEEGTGAVEGDALAGVAEEVLGGGEAARRQGLPVAVEECCGEELSIESFGMRETLTLSDEQLMTLLQAAFAARPFLIAAGGALQREAAVAWVESLLQSMLSRGRRLCPLTDYQKKELYTLVCTIFRAL